MSRQIEAGDMVRVVWGCCARSRERIGVVATVELVRDTGIGCAACGWSSSLSRCADMPDDVRPLSWLIRVPPAKAKTEREREAETT